jgi:lipopolysaccharide export system protein LptC
MTDHLKSFEGGGPRRARAPGAAYTRFVRLSKIILPLAALAIVGLVTARLSENPLSGVGDVKRSEKTTPGQTEVMNAQYEGVDTKGRPYTLIAEKAARDPALPDTVDLTRLKAAITLEDQTWLAVQAAGGAYDTKAEHLALTGGVEAFHDSGYTMRAQDLDVDLKTRHAVSKNPVHAQGPLGEITGANMEVVDEGGRVLFGGPATIVFRHLGRGR